MVAIDIDVPGFGIVSGHTPIVILGTNGSGKTKLAQRIAANPAVTSVGAQRRTWVDDSLPVQEENQMQSNIKNYENNWRSNAWQPTDEINYILSNLVQEHSTALSRRNEEAIVNHTKMDPVTDTKLIRLQAIWKKVYPARELEIGGFFPQVRREGAPGQKLTYKLREMSDGERSILYLAARVLHAKAGIVLVDEPELHLHTRLAVEFWSEMERMRPECRFIYVTHDLNFALSRRRAAILVARPGQTAEAVVVEALPESVAAEILGAATLPFHASRIFFFEGEGETAFASEFFAAWFNDGDTFAVPAGNRDAVLAAVAGLSAVGVSGAKIEGLVDRDFYPDAALSAAPLGVQVLGLHEIESVICDPAVVAALSRHLGKDENEVLGAFSQNVRSAFSGKTLNYVIAQRVRFRVNDLLRGAFDGNQILDDYKKTEAAHIDAVAKLDLAVRLAGMFEEEQKRVLEAVTKGGNAALELLPGKHLLSLLPRALGVANAAEVTGLVVKAIAPPIGSAGDGVRSLGLEIEAAMNGYLPARKLSKLSTTH